MKYYKNDNNEIFAFNDDFDASSDIARLNLKAILETEINDILSSTIDERTKQLAELEAEIAECENHIRHALIIGNNAVLESLRAELKELITQREELK
ncbi:hypothetical protein MTT09_06595 [Campylobacter concisus]|uniref:hypothetical protein n=1 Tax=Campylobacter concisus TaxID=199 RepID=UPI003D2210C2